MEKIDREIRRKVLKGASIITNNGSSTINCVIKDISSKGARLKMNEISLLPQQFDVLFITDGIKRHAKLIWHRSKEIGVEFIDKDNV